MVDLVGLLISWSRQFLVQNHCRFFVLGESEALASLLKSPIIYSSQFSIGIMFYITELNILRAEPVGVFGGL